MNCNVIKNNRLWSGGWMGLWQMLWIRHPFNKHSMNAKHHWFTKLMTKIANKWHEKQFATECPVIFIDSYASAFGAVCRVTYDRYLQTRMAPKRSMKSPIQTCPTKSSSTTSPIHSTRNWRTTYGRRVWNHWNRCCHRCPTPSHWWLKTSRPTNGSTSSASVRWVSLRAATSGALPSAWVASSWAPFATIGERICVYRCTGRSSGPSPDTSGTGWSTGPPFPFCSCLEH